MSPSIIGSNVVHGLPDADFADPGKVADGNLQFLGNGKAEQAVDLLQVLPKQKIEHLQVGVKFCSPNHQNQSLPSAI